MFSENYTVDQAVDLFRKKRGSKCINSKQIKFLKNFKIRDNFYLDLDNGRKSFLTENSNLTYLIDR